MANAFVVQSLAILLVSAICSWESEWLAKNNPEANPITRKQKTVAEQFSWVPVPTALHPGAFPIKSFALSAHLFPQTMHFWVLDKSPLLGPGRGRPSCNAFSITLLVCEMSATVLKFECSLTLPFLGIRMKTDLFHSCGYCWVFQICWHIECSTFIASSFRI